MAHTVIVIVNLDINVGHGRDRFCHKISPNEVNSVTSFAYIYFLIFRL